MESEFTSDLAYLAEQPRNAIISHMTRVKMD